MSIDVTRDSEGLLQALGELLEEEFAFSRVRHQFEEAGDYDREHILEGLPPRTLSPGYYRWGAYVIWLDARIASLAFTRLDMREVDGLVALQRARAEWESKHPKCACGAHQDSRFASCCHACGLEFRQKGAA